jgi:hypothetical protein
LPLPGERRAELLVGQDAVVDQHLPELRPAPAITAPGRHAASGLAAPPGTRRAGRGCRHAYGEESRVLVTKAA